MIFATLLMKIRLSYESTQLFYTTENTLAVKKSYTEYSMFLIYSSIKQEFIKLEYNCIITNNITQSAHNKYWTCLIQEHNNILISANKNTSLDLIRICPQLLSNNIKKQTVLVCCHHQHLLHIEISKIQIHLYDIIVFSCESRSLMLLG